MCSRDVTMRLRIRLSSAVPSTASRRLADVNEGDLLLERNAVGMDGNGRYTIVFTKAGDVFTRRYDHDGSATRPDSQIGRDEQIVSGRTGYPAIATASTGATVVHYQFRVDDSASGVPTWWSVVARVESAGSPAPLPARVSIEQVKYYAAGGAVVDVADDGSFVATFLDTVVGERVLDPALNGPLKLFVKRFDAAGVLTDTERVNQGSERTVLEGPQAAIANSGRNWVVTWADDPGRDGQGTSVRARSFARGQRGPASQVNVTPDGDQQLPAVAMGPGGQAIVAWQSTVRFTVGAGTGFTQTFRPTATLLRRFDVDGGGGRNSLPASAVGAPLSAERVEATANDAALPLDLSCPAQRQTTCTFDVTARAASARLGASAASAVTGRRTFRVRSGRVTSVQLGLSGAARSALRARGRLALRMTVAARAGEKARTYRGPVTLLARQASAIATAAGVADVRVLGGRWVSEADAVVRAFDGRALAATARLRTGPGLVRSVRLALGAAQRAKLRAGRAVRLRIVVSERNPLAEALGDLEPAMRILVQRSVAVLPAR